MRSIKLKKFLELCFTLLNYLEDAEEKNYKETEEAEREGHIYLTILEIRKQLEQWQEFYKNEYRWLTVTHSNQSIVTHLDQSIK